MLASTPNFFGPLDRLSYQLDLSRGIVSAKHADRICDFSQNFLRPPCLSTGLGISALLDCVVLVVLVIHVLRGVEVIDQQFGTGLTRYQLIKSMHGFQEHIQIFVWFYQFLSSG